MPAKGWRKYRDDIEDLPVSKQRKSQLRKFAAGKCDCGEPLDGGYTNCRDCRKKKRAYQRMMYGHRPQKRYRDET